MEERNLAACIKDFDLPDNNILTKIVEGMVLSILYKDKLVILLRNCFETYCIKIDEFNNYFKIL